jgi:hypothetical protein
MTLVSKLIMLETATLPLVQVAPAVPAVPEPLAPAVLVLPLAPAVLVLPLAPAVPEPAAPAVPAVPFAGSSLPVPPHATTNAKAQPKPTKRSEACIVILLAGGSAAPDVEGRYQLNRLSQHCAAEMGRSRAAKCSRAATRPGEFLKSV